MTDLSRNEDSRKIADRLETAADNVSDMTHRKVEGAINAATDRAAEEVATMANAATEAADEFDLESPQAQVADQMAARLGDLAGVLQKTDFDAVIGKVSHAAREHPALFLGGAALLGFAATRFLKASGPAPARVQDEELDDPWTGHVTGHASGHGRHDSADRRNEKRA